MVGTRRVEYNTAPRQNMMPAFSNMSAIAASAIIPMQPGNNIDFTFTQRNSNFARSTTLDYASGTAVDKWKGTTQKRELGANRTTTMGGAWSSNSGPRSWTAPNTFAGGKLPTTKSSVASYLDQPRTLPAFVHLDKVSLRFKCWFKDDLALLTGPDRIIIHKAIITYNLIDDTFSAMEPRQENSGLNQGVLLRRQNLVNPDTGDNYTWRDLGIGRDLMVRGQTYHLIDCDHYTRNWYAEQNIMMEEPLQAPLDPFEIREMKERKKRKDYEMAKQRRVQAEMMHTEEVKHRFLTYDRKVLRFYGVWDDRQNIFGQRHYVTVRFYLFDFTIDMQEREGSPSGLKTRFLVRQRIPRDFKNLDDMKIADDGGFVGLDDLQIGSIVNIFGKHIFIYDCDQFSRRYLEQMAGPVPAPVPIDEASLQIPRLPTPPSNGMGSEEDSIQNCRMLRPKPARKDMGKYKKYAGKVMRFTAKWDSPRPEESCRTFIISFYPADDTLSIWETSGNGRNTGMASGKFLERMKLQKPGTSGSKIAYYQQHDLHIGATVVAQTRKFVVTSMDRFTQRLMDNGDGPEVTVEQSTLSMEERLRERISREDALEIRDKCRIKDRSKISLLSLEPLMEILADYLYGFTDKDIMSLVDSVRGDTRDYSGMINYEVFCERFLGLDPDGGANPMALSATSSAASNRDRQQQQQPTVLPPIPQAKAPSPKPFQAEPLRPEGGSRGGSMLVPKPAKQQTDEGAWQPASTNASFQWDEPGTDYANDPDREWVGGNTVGSWEDEERAFSGGRGGGGGGDGGYGGYGGGGGGGGGGGAAAAVAEDGAAIEWASGNEYFD